MVGACLRALNMSPDGETSLRVEPRPDAHELYKAAKRMGCARERKSARAVGNNGSFLCNMQRDADMLPVSALRRTRNRLPALN